MEVAVNLADQDFASAKSLGILRVSLGLTRGLVAAEEVERLHVLANSSLRRSAEMNAGKVAWHREEHPPPRRWARLWWDQTGVVRAANRLKPDWLLFPKGFPPGVLWPRCRVCCYVHDNLFDFYNRRKQNPFPLWERLYFPWLLRRALRRADLVVTNSRFTLETLRPFNPKARCEHLGIGFGRFPDPPSVPAGGGLLLLASPLPHKMTSQAVDWLWRWNKETGNRRPVHVLGSLPRGLRLPGPERWHWHKRLPEPEYQALKRECAVLLYFSAYEGYGMPPAEALAEGLPALASDIPASREILPAEILFDNNNYRDFADKLNRILEIRHCPHIQLPTREEVSKKLVQLMREYHPAGF